MKLNLQVELAKGPHYYDHPQIRAQLKAPVKPLQNEMKRFFLDEYKPLADQEPKTTKRIRTSIKDAAEGRLSAEDYAPELWKVIEPMQEEIQLDLNKFGPLQKLTLVGRTESAGQKTYLCRVDFRDASVLHSFTIDTMDKIAAVKSEGTERR